MPCGPPQSTTGRSSTIRRMTNTLSRIARHRACSGRPGSQSPRLSAAAPQSERAVSQQPYRQRESQFLKRLFRHRPSQPDQLSRDRWRLELRHPRQCSGLGSSRLARNAKGGEDSAEIAERIGQYDCHSSRVRGWDSSRILLWNYRQHRVFAKTRGTVKSASREPHYSASRTYTQSSAGGPQGGRSSAQKLNDACKLMMRFAVCELYGPPASAFDSPNCGEVRIPIGVARLT